MRLQPHITDWLKSAIKAEDVPDILPAKWPQNILWLFIVRNILSKIRKLFLLISILYKEAFDISRWFKVFKRAAVILLFAIFAYNVVFNLQPIARPGWKPEGFAINGKE